MALINIIEIGHLTPVLEFEFESSKAHNLCECRHFQWQHRFRGQVGKCWDPDCDCKGFRKWP